jgi:hypothetical protein
LRRKSTKNPFNCLLLKQNIIEDLQWMGEKNGSAGQGTDNYLYYSVF